MVLITFCAIAAARAFKYEAALEASYEKSLNSFAEYVSDMDDSLNRGIYAASGARVSDMCTNLWRDSYEAMSAMSSLPMEELDLKQTYDFLSKVAEYCKSLESKLARGEKLTEKERQTLVEIGKHISKMKSAVSRLRSIYVNSDAKITGGANLSLAGTSKFASGASSKTLTEFSQGLADAPQLIYDGPYSDGDTGKTSKALNGLRSYSKVEAREIARRASEKIKGDFSDAHITKGDMPCYSFKKGNSVITISQKGGKLVSITCSQTVKNPVYSMEKCLDAAKKYIAECGYKNMECNYYESVDGIFTANFNYKDKDVSCYADSVKVSVNMGTGKVCGFDAVNYLNSHTERTYEKAKIALSEAEKKLNRHLKVESRKVAMIPKNADEKLCYEFRCKTDSGKDEEILVYVNMQTGEEEDILILVSNERGVLTK